MKNVQGRQKRGIQRMERRGDGHKVRHVYHDISLFVPKATRVTSHNRTQSTRVACTHTSLPSSHFLFLYRNMLGALVLLLCSVLMLLILLWAGGRGRWAMCGRVNQYFTRVQPVPHKCSLRCSHYKQLTFYISSLFSKVLLISKARCLRNPALVMEVL